MARKFVDTSALLKLYVPEPDSAVIQSELAFAATLIISRLTLLELPSAVYGKVRSGDISASDAAIAIASFESGLSLFQVLPISEEVLICSRTLIDAHGVKDRLRPPDAIQIATALQEHYTNTIDTFVSTDRDQRVVAHANGFALFP
jgi:predicted nucleic acid-binding protein